MAINVKQALVLHSRTTMISARASKTR